MCSTKNIQRAYEDYISGTSFQKKTTRSLDTYCCNLAHLMAYSREFQSKMWLTPDTYWSLRVVDLMSEPMSGVSGHISGVSEFSFGCPNTCPKYLDVYPEYPGLCPCYSVYFSDHPKYILMSFMSVIKAGENGSMRAATPI